MIRIQESWLVETVMDCIKDFNPDLGWYFPTLWKFTALEWFSHLDTNITINVPIHSQAVLFKSWFTNSEAFPDEELLKAFNQILMKSIDININPFRSWLNTYFTKQQLDYLLYWREAANELNTEPIKESFLAIVYQVMNYWLANNKAGFDKLLPPDEILAYYYKRFRAFREHQAIFKVSDESLESLNPLPCSVAVFNIIFNDEDYIEDELLFIYHAWFYGHTDIEEAKRSFTNELKAYSIEFGENQNFNFYKKLSENAENLAFCWSGKGISPNLYKRKLVEQLQHQFSDKYTHSKLVYKPIDSSTNTYDYILLFY